MKPVQPPAAPRLTADEQRILDAFRRMDRREKDRYLILMSGSAENYPERKRPVLRLVIGGGL